MGIKSNNPAAYYFNVFGGTGTGALPKDIPQYHWYNTLVDSSNIERWYDVTISPKEGDVSEYVYAQGDTRSQGQGGFEALIAQYDKEGAIQWQRILGSAGNENYQGGVVVDSSGNVYAGGYQTANYYGLFVKYNSSGTLQFQKQYYPTGYGCVSGSGVRGWNSNGGPFFPSVHPGCEPRNNGTGWYSGPDVYNGRREYTYRGWYRPQGSVNQTGQTSIWTR